MAKEGRREDAERWRSLDGWEECVREGGEGKERGEKTRADSRRHESAGFDFSPYQITIERVTLEIAKLKTAFLTSVNNIKRSTDVDYCLIVVSLF